MLTLPELKARLAASQSEVDLVEILEITTEDIVERFDDLIAEKFEELAALVTEEGEEDSDAD